MDGQNFQNGFNNDQNVQSTPVVEPVVTPVSTPMTETVNVNTGSYSYQDNTAQYGAPVYGQSEVMEEKKTPGLAIGALVMGIVSILLSCCCGSGIIFSIAGLIMAIVANKKQKSGVGTAALICSIVGIVFNLGMILYYLVVGGAAYMSEM